MDEHEIASLRLRNQQLIARKEKSAAAVVARLGAMQAQDYTGVLWSVGMRMAERSADATEAGVERALADGSIVRTWPMRRTLHLVAAADVRWMLALLAPRALAAAARNRALLGVTDVDLARSRDLFTRALEGGRCLTRAEMLDTLDAGGVTTAGQRGYHILVNLAMAGLLCLGPRAGKQQTWLLLDEWVSPAPSIERTEALGKLAARYFTGHGPATIKDFVWWAGMTAGDARIGVAEAGDVLASVNMNKTEYWMGADAPPPADRKAPRLLLLPGFDEYLLGYTDRSAVLDPAHAQLLHPGANGVFKPAVIADGHVVAMWKRTLKANGVRVELDAFDTMDPTLADTFASESIRYTAFLREGQ